MNMPAFILFALLVIVFTVSIWLLFTTISRVNSLEDRNEKLEEYCKDLLAANAEQSKNTFFQKERADRVEKELKNLTERIVTVKEKLPNKDSDYNRVMQLSNELTDYVIEELDGEGNPVGIEITVLKPLSEKPVAKKSPKNARKKEKEA